MKFNEKYNQDSFLEFLSEFLPEDYLSKEEDVVLNSGRNKEITKAKILGYSESLDLAILEMDHENEGDSRIAIATDAFKILADHWIHRALVVFKNNGSENYRLSYLTVTLDLNDKNKAIKKFSNARRYSFYLGTNAKVRTPEQQLIKKGRVKDSEDLLSRFSVEVVNKQFYLEVAKFFDELVSHEGKKLVLPSVSEENINARKSFAVRLIGRIMFCWFLKQKKSDSGQLIPDGLLSSRAVKENYYHEILEHLFFSALNTSIDSRDIRSDLFDKVPYLNGGLFSPQSDDFYELDRGTFTSKSINTLRINDSWFRDFFELLETYNFTIDENTVFDQELSVDPEMLGRIFESLLAEISPETGNSDRKRTGSFYTPRQIVEYMVDQTLIEYFKTKTNIDENKLAALVSYDLIDDSLYPLDDNEKLLIVEAVESLKILDPACGSGAYPIGALQKLVYVLQCVDPDCRLWLERKLVGVPDLYKQKIIKEVKSNPFDYTRKLDVIKNTIFGVDIQPIAVDISRLRCFLTLVVESEIDDTKPNRGIEPLPNLDFKFVCANALISLPKLESSGLFEDHSGIVQLSKLMADYFSCNTQRKNEIRLKFLNVQKDILEKTISAFGRNTGELTMKLTTWNPFSNASNSWFDSEWMFGLEEKFDVVMGNPPYVQLQKNGGELADLCENAGYATFCRSGDIYTLFFERGINLLKDKGYLCFITSNKWMRTSYGERLREYFSKLNPLKLIDFAGFQIFETAAVDTTIMLVQNSKYSNTLQAVHFKNDFEKGGDIGNYFTSHCNKLEIQGRGTWFIGEQNLINLKTKIESIGTQLKNWPDLSINYGIKTGANDVFIVNQLFKDEIVRLEPKVAEHIKPLLRGLHVRDYKVDWNNDYILYIPWHFPLSDKKIKGASDEAELAFKLEYPNLYQYFVKNKERLCERNRAETGIRYEWYALQRSGSSYRDDFQKSKVVWMNMNRGWKFAYSKPGFFVDMTLNFLASDKYTKIMTGVLSSKVHKWYFKQTGRIFDNGGYMTKVDSVSNFPVPLVNDLNSNIYNKIEQLVDLMVEKDLIKADVIKLNNLVCELYNLSPKEIDIIDGGEIS